MFKSVIEYNNKISLLWTFSVDLNLILIMNSLHTPALIFCLRLRYLCHSFLYITNFTISTNVSLHGILTRWSTKNQYEYQRSGEMADLLVARILTLLMFKVFTLHVLKWSTDNTIVLSHGMASWCLWWTQSYTAESLGSFCSRERERKSLNKW